METSLHQFDQERFRNMPIIGILRGMETDNLSFILDAFYRGGLTTIEITMNSSEAEEQIRSAVEHFSDRLNVGAGTVRHPGELTRALDAGATFIVSPNVNEEVIRECKKKQIPIFAGALTPTEVYQAFHWGADMVKVFPASVMGPDYIKSLKGPLETIPLIATGGIDETNMIDYLKAGAFGFGMGSTLFDKKLISTGNWEGLKDQIQNYAGILQGWRG